MNTKKTSKLKAILLAVILILTTVLLPMLQSCDEDNSIINSEIDSGNDSINSDNLDDSDNETSSIENKTPAKKPDLTPVKAQKPTNKLVIYIYSFTERLLTPALNIFKEKYPDVEIELHTWDGINSITTDGGTFSTSVKEEVDAYRQVLRTELMAGKGPDLIVTMYYDIDNIYKMMDSGIFADLNPLLENDSEFNFNNYNKAVLDAGIYKGKQYLTPLDYNVPVLMTTQEILDAERIKLSDLNTFDNFINTINKYNEKYKNNPKKSVFKNDSPSALKLISYTFPWCGVDIIDYENGKVKIDDPRFKTIMDAMKWAYVPQKDEVLFSVNGPGITADALQNQEWLFDFTYGPTSYNSIAGLLRFRELTPVFLTYPNIDNKTTASVGTFAAIPKTSQNQINAYNLLKIILSEDIQSETGCLTYTPVLNKSARTIFEDDYAKSVEMRKKNFLYEWEGSSSPKEEADKYINMLTNIDSCKLIENTSYDDFFIKDMRPYYEGKQSFEQFANKLKNDLELYISE